MNGRTLSARFVGLILLGGLGCGGEGASEGEWGSNLIAAQTGSVTVGGTDYLSSTKLEVRWNPPLESVDHYEVIATDPETNQSVTYTITGSSTQTVLTNLKSGTTYSIALKACLDIGCSRSLSADGTTTAETAEETWQLQGTGNSFPTATELISDSNNMPYAFRYGSGAPADLLGKVRLYYNPDSVNEKGPRPAILSNVASNSVSSVLSYTKNSGYGVRWQDSGGGSGPKFMTFQAVPLSASMGGRVRLFAEVQGTDNLTRIFSLDSQDGYLGQDFNPSTSTEAFFPTDFGSGGPCTLTPVIGVEGDPTEGNPGIQNARQFKIGYPILDDWRWDGAVGTFMIFTVEFVDASVSSTSMNAGYAVWNGSQWIVQYEDSTHPKYFSGTQAPMPVHLGESRYKMYYRENSTATGDSFAGPGSQRPMKVIYAEGDRTGDPSWVDYEDWDSVSSAREVNYLWPDGTEMDLASESMLDDFVIFAPTGDGEFQVMYSNIGDGTTIPIIGTLVLMNP